MDYKHFDTRGYPTLPVSDGYREWAGHYEDSVCDEMDLRLLERLKTVHWGDAGTALDLACGTGRIGVWLARQGVAVIDGVDFTAEMLERARAKGVYRDLRVAPVTDTGLAAESYDIVTQVLADEHLPDLRPLYHEAARVTREGGVFVLVGYHPFALMNGQPTHFHRQADDAPITIESYVHLTSDHVRAAHEAGWTLNEMDEGVVDADWLSTKPKWERYRNRPVSFAMVWKQA